MKTRDRRHSDHLRWSWHVDHWKIRHDQGFHYFLTIRDFANISGKSQRLPRMSIWFVGWAICGLSLLLVLSFAPRGFSPGTPVSPSPQKPTLSNFNSTRNQVDEEPLCGCATSKSLFIYYLFIYLFVTWGLEPTNKRIGSELILISPINRWLALKFFYLTMENFHE